MQDYNESFYNLPGDDTGFPFGIFISLRAIFNSNNGFAVLLRVPKRTEPIIGGGA